ncbi:TIGR03086 family metal-binding protein [Pseudonocardia lacus]|uniref:TIGR03086 family metal-binding protein n=1 Tax=Pseudonocardia lacus TaxID=2835865 RepID=UPI001BDC9A85|nr:TIGR03086 family metal-binding protein [Pseudonocardia lacus]
MPTALLPTQLMTAAAAPLPAIVRAAAAAPLDSPTPCADWDLAALVRHQLYWAPFLAAAGRRTAATPTAATEQDVALDDWPAALDAAHADVVAAWTDEAAWTGTTTMGGPEPMPAPVIGNMVLGELVVHGSDLARAAGTAAHWPDDVLAPILEAVREMGPTGRDMGIFGPEVDVPADAPLLDRILAATGRTP